MNKDSAKLALPAGWSIVVDRLYDRMKECGVDNDKLLSVIESHGYAIFLFGAVPIKQFHDVVEWAHSLQLLSHELCAECGAKAVAYTETSLPVCEKHGREVTIG